MKRFPGLEFKYVKREELKAAVEVMARAFVNYEYFTIFFPDREERMKTISDLNYCALRTTFGKTNCIVAKQNDKIVALAIVDPPGYKVPSMLQYLLHGALLLFIKHNARLINRWLTMDEKASRTCHDYQKSAPDVWYLSSFVVDPSVQGQGIGTRFIAYMEDYIRDRGGKQFILFTNSKDNLAYYRKRGFEVFHTEEIVYEGKVMGSWSMKKVL